jgi:hypothetical protein
MKLFIRGIEKIGGKFPKKPAEQNGRAMPKLPMADCDVFVNRPASADPKIAFLPWSAARVSARASFIATHGSQHFRPLVLPVPIRLAANI